MRCDSAEQEHWRIIGPGGFKKGKLENIAMAFCFFSSKVKHPAGVTVAPFNF